MKMKKFDKEYRKITGIVGMPSKDFYVSPEPFPLSIVDEMKHLEMNIGQEALGFLKSCLKQDYPVKVDLDKLKSKIRTSWKHYCNFCVGTYGQELWVVETDFSKPGNIKKQIRKVQPDYAGEFGEDNGSYGLYVRLSDSKHMILLATRANKDDGKLEHEFTHFVQLLTDEMKLDKSIGLDKIKACFDVSEEYVDYILDEHEFWAHMYVDVFNGLQKIYWVKFKEIFTWEEFIDFQFRKLSEDFVVFSKTLLFDLWNAVVKKNQHYIKVLAAIGFANKSFYDEIVEKLKNKEA